MLHPAISQHGRSASSTRLPVRRAIRHRLNASQTVLSRTVLGKAQPEKTGGGPAKLFNRDAELVALKRLFTGTPACITVLTGPVSSGKTALIRQLREELRDGIDVFDVDLRLVTSPAVLGARFQRLAIARSSAGSMLERAVAAATSWLTHFWGGAKVSESSLGPGTIEFSRSAMNAASGITAVLDEYGAALAHAKRKGKPPPLFILDECNKLAAWDSAFASERRTLLDFFVAAAKQEMTAHVLLVTADTGFVDWISKETQPQFIDSIVLEDMRESTAREFLSAVGLRNPRFALCDSLWGEVFKVCGGNAGALIRFGKLLRAAPAWGAFFDDKARSEGAEIVLIDRAVKEDRNSPKRVAAWDGALQSIVNYEQGLASRLLAESPSFAREYAAVALELLRSPGGVSINSIPGEERRKWMAQVKANSICYLVGRRLADDDDGTGEAVVRGVNAAGAGGGGVHGEVCRAAAYLERDEGGTAGDSHGSRSCWRRRGPALNDDDDVVGFPLQHSSPLRC